MVPLLHAAQSGTVLSTPSGCYHHNLLLVSNQLERFPSVYVLPGQFKSCFCLHRAKIFEDVRRLIQPGDTIDQVVFDSDCPRSVSFF